MSDDQCVWVGNGRRCRDYGTVSYSTLGGGQKYCGKHFMCRSQEEGMRILEESFRHEQPTIESLDRAYMAEVATMLAAHGLARLSGESSHEQALRARAWCLERVRDILKPPADSRQWARDIVDACVRDDVLCHTGVPGGARLPLTGQKINDYQLRSACLALNVDVVEVRRMRGEG